MNQYTQHHSSLSSNYYRHLKKTRIERALFQAGYTVHIYTNVTTARTLRIVEPREGTDRRAAEARWAQ